MYLSLYCKGSKRVTQGFIVRGSWRSNRTAIYWPPLLWPSALSFSFSRAAQQEAQGPTLLAFSTASYHQLVWSPNSIGVPEDPFSWVWLSLPHLIYNSSDLQLIRGRKGPFHWAFSTTSYQQLLCTPTHQGLQGPSPPGFLYHILSVTSLDPNSSGAPSPFGLVWLSLPHLISNSVQSLSDFLFWPSYIIVQRPLNLWNGMFDCHQAEITVVQFRGHSSSASVWVYHGFYLVPFHQPNPPTQSLSITGHWDVSLPSGASLWNGMFGRVEGQNTTWLAKTYFNVCWHWL